MWLLFLICDLLFYVIDWLIRLDESFDKYYDLLAEQNEWYADFREESKQFDYELKLWLEESQAEVEYLKLIYGFYDDWWNFTNNKLLGR